MTWLITSLQDIPALYIALTGQDTMSDCHSCRVCNLTAQLLSRVYPEEFPEGMGVQSGFAGKFCRERQERRQRSGTYATMGSSTWTQVAKCVYKGDCLREIKK